MQTSMIEKVEIRSLVDGAWYEAYPRECSIVWAFSRPFIRVKFTDFGYEHCELFELENLFQKRFRKPFIVAELTDTFATGDRIIGLATSDTEQKWFDAEAQKVIQTEDDVLVVVEWRMGLSRYSFGTPTERVLSLKRGEVGRVQPVLSPTSDPLLQTWEKALRELCGDLSTKYLEVEDDTPTTERTLAWSEIEETSIETYAPSSLVQSMKKRQTAENAGQSLDEATLRKKGRHQNHSRLPDE